VATLTSTTFTSIMIICVSTTCWTSTFVIDSHETFYAFQQNLDNLSFYGHSNHKCDMHMKMSFVFFDLVMPLLWLPPWFSLSSFCMSPHCDFSSHNSCNVCQSSLHYFVFLLLLSIWYYVVLTMHSSLLQ
jgi:hypothetical protein